MHKKETILVVGGYGKVGREISRLLAATNQYHLIIAGRNKLKAISEAKGLGENVSGDKFDINRVGDEEHKILSQAKNVIVCLDQVNNHFIKLCYSNSIRYFDISANTDFLLDILRLSEFRNQDKVLASGLIVTSLGLCPGLTNLLAAELLSRYPEAERIETGILLGLGEKHGKASIEWTIKNLAYDFQYAGNTIKSFMDSRFYNFPPPLDKRKCYRFNFSDQHTLKLVYPTINFATRLCFDSKFITELLHWIRKTGVVNLLKNKWIFNAVVDLFDRFSFGSMDYSVVVTATKSRDILGSIALSGVEEATITAKSAAACINHIIQHKREMTGIYDIQEILSIHDILPQIKDDLTACEGL